ncbi:MAG: hypothetical protein IJ438_00395 [Clostridia bacterium]|nr:hypothetical protein [Clostridia bacterium]
MKKLFRRILKGIGCVILTGLILLLAWRFLWGRNWSGSLRPQRWIDISYESAMDDGMLTDEEIAIHYAPQIDAAVNVLLSGGKGDFITAVDYDGDWVTLNNWENMTEYPLNAVVYYSVQETDTHYFIGYYFYHPRDDAEIWLDRHENDLEGIMLAVPKGDDGYLPPEIMYTQGHGNVYFYFGDGLLDGSKMQEGSVYGGALARTGDRAWVYITPNGTLVNAGHSVESADNHSVYWSVGDSGVRYTYGGEAQEPVSFNGAFEDHPCSYELRSLDELWALRNGPYGDESAFGSFGAFRGDNFGTDKANPPWGWRNKNAFGYSGSFLSDPAWTINHAMAIEPLSAEYISNDYADWRITLGQAVIPTTVDVSDCTVHLIRDGWEMSQPTWFELTKRADGSYCMNITGESRSVLYVAAPKNTIWRMEIRNSAGQVVLGSVAVFTAEYIGE